MNEEGLRHVLPMPRLPALPPLVGLVVSLLVASACSDGEEEDRSVAETSEASEDGTRVETDDPRRVDTRPPPMHQPVPLWRDGEKVKEVDAATASLHGYVVLDLGDGWTPYIFTDRGSEDEEPIPNTYRETYLALANRNFPDDHHGDRARSDKYLELYGIMPTLSVLRERLQQVMKLGCADSLDLEPLETYDGFLAYRSNKRARWVAEHHRFLTHHVERMKREQGVSSMAALDADALERQDRQRLKELRDLDPDVKAVRAAQQRLECEGYLKGKGRIVRGGLDWATHEALAEFERRHRIYGWGFIGRKTLEALRQTPAELERRAVVRMLTERAMHAAGVIEDGSMSTKPNGEPRTFEGADGKQHPIPDLEEQLRKAIVSAFGLETPESTLAWLESLGDLPREEPRYVAFDGPELPEYYDGDMNLTVSIDRGDVWYDFPYDEEGNQRSQPVQRRPKLTIFTEYLGQRIPLARMGTTIGGWRSENVDGTVMWKYKDSPVGERVWHQIVAAPVWLPPKSTPPHDLLDRNPDGKGKEAYEVDYHETGPSYASAYGLVAAYHIKYRRLPDGGYDLGGDEGIRTHGSVDYMSIMRRHSHGCHRLHNHLAVRLMSFVLAHRPHRRVGMQEVGYRMGIEKDDHEYTLKIDNGGYVFQLERPVHVHVLEGRIRGDVKKPIKHPIPQYDPDAGAYVHPDAGPVKVSSRGKLTPYELPTDGGVDGAAVVPADSSDGGVVANPYRDDPTVTKTSPE
ncbi:MAG: peptidoglycan-binding domain-containing protein [Myxococcota bacterium]